MQAVTDSTIMSDYACKLNLEQRRFSKEIYKI